MRIFVAGGTGVSDIDSPEVGTLMVSTLEGSLMVSRLQRNDDVRDGPAVILRNTSKPKFGRTSEARSREPMTITEESSSRPDFRERAQANDVPVARLIRVRSRNCWRGRGYRHFRCGTAACKPMGSLHGGILCDIADAAMGLRSRVLWRQMNRSRPSN